MSIVYPCGGSCGCRVPLLPSLSHQYYKESRSSSIRRLRQSLRVVSDSGVHSRSSVRLPGRPLRQCPRLPRPTTFSDVPGVACRSERRGIYCHSRRHPQRVILATPLKRTALNLLPRRVRSVSSRALRQGGFAMLPAVSSLLPFPYRGE